MFKALKSKLGFNAAVLVLISLIAGCTFRTPAPVSPLVNSLGEKISKDFFYKKNSFSTMKQSDQTFLASWAPIDEKGGIAESFLLGGVPQAMHLNIRWKITEHALLGYKINPSFSDKPQDQDNQAIIEIPIARHYYYEQEKDGKERPTNRFIKNEDRDAWNYRPYMDLDFDKMVVNSWAFSIIFNKPQIIQVTEVEWDSEKEFLGFTVEAKDAYINSAQARFRFNFLAFHPTPGFKPLPFDNQMAKYINVLHVLGKTAQGDTPVTYAGHWDLSKPITMFTHGVPNDEVMDIIADSVEEWNIGFQNAGIVPRGQKVIVLNRKPLDYPFDLRYPVINWVDDKRKSMHAPLGIGLAIGDVHTGELQYSSVSIWGGMMRDLVNRFISSEAGYAGVGADGSSLKKIDISAMFNTTELSAKFRSPVPGGQDLQEYFKSEDAMKRVISGTQNAGARWISDLESKGIQASPGDAPVIDPGLAQAWREQAEKAKLDGENSMAGIYMENISSDLFRPANMDDPERNRLDVFYEVFSKDLFIRPLDPEKQQYLSYMPYEQYEQLAMKQVDVAAQKSAVADLWDTERTFEVLSSQINPADLDQRQAFRSLAKAVIVHEIGHVIGLGHNFKGNVMPEEGTIAQENYEELKHDLQERGHISTTIMDYYNGRTEVSDKYDEIKVGIYDLQMLRYLYKSEYPAIADNGKASLWLPIPQDGLPQDIAQVTVDGVTKDYRPGFLPACNDITASTNQDPLCMRWDRGSSATEIMKNRFADLNAGLMATLNAFSTAKGSYAPLREWSLWARVMSEFSQVRIFYDYMRYLIDETPQFANAFAKISKSEIALLNFSNACIDPTTAPTQEMKEAFAALALKDPAKLADIESGSLQSLRPEDFTQVHDLCQANQYALLQFNELLKRKGHDHTVYDRTRRYIQVGVTGGEVNLDWGLLWGAYKEIGSLPLRYMTLFTVTNPKPIAMSWMGVAPVPVWAMDQSRYAYSSLYPFEFSSIINTAVKENLNFGGASGEKTEVGTSLLFMNYFLWRNFSQSMDNFNRFPKSYIDNLRSLSSFDIGVTPILLTNLPKANGPVDEVFRYKAAYVDQARRDTIDLPFAYMLPEREVIAKGNQQQIFMQVSKFRYLTDSWGYYWALELRYHYKQGQDPLKGNSVKFSIEELNQDQIDSCVDDGGRGLSHFFSENNDKFLGFKVGTGIAAKQSLQDAFDLSVRTTFETYHATKFLERYPDPEACNEAVKGIGLTVLGGALINGYWLPQTSQYLNH